MRHDVVQLIAKTLCECDGKDWKTIFSPERDRYARIAILIDDRLTRQGRNEATGDRGLQGIRRKATPN